MTSIPITCIVGATASGKTALAVHMAQALDAEIISADALTVYRGMDIGTAKPTVEEQAGIVHHCMDCLEPEDACDAQRWYDMANAAIEDIHQRGKRIIVAGGTPLYMKLLLEGISAGPPSDAHVRDRLQQEYDEQGGEALLARLTTVDPIYASERHPNDARRIIRGLEVYELSGKPFSSFHTTDGKRREELTPTLLGIRREKELLHQRINRRVKDMFEAGLVQEVAGLRDRLCKQALAGVGYKEVVGYLDGEYDQDHAIYLIQRATRMLAKHQLTWYRRFTDIHWL